MTKPLIVLGLASLFCLSAMAETFSGTGVLSDSRCGVKHAAAADSDVQCIKACIKRGATPVLLTDGKAINISSSSNDQVAPHMGEKVTVKGTLEKDRFGQVLTVESITKAE